jgi:hypothetical protein
VERSPCQLTLSAVVEGSRIFIVVALTALYFKARDPLFLFLDAIVLVGLLPSIYVAVRARRAR